MCFRRTGLSQHPTLAYANSRTQHAAPKFSHFEGRCLPAAHSFPRPWNQAPQGGTVKHHGNTSITISQSTEGLLQRNTTLNPLGISTFRPRIWKSYQNFYTYRFSRLGGIDKRHRCGLSKIHENRVLDHWGKTLSEKAV